jgi:hypothetical protein
MGTLDYSFARARREAKRSPRKPTERPCTPEPDTRGIKVFGELAVHRESLERVLSEKSAVARQHSAGFDQRTRRPAQLASRGGERGRRCFGIDLAAPQICPGYGVRGLHNTGPLPGLPVLLDCSHHLPSRGIKPTRLLRFQMLADRPDLFAISKVHIGCLPAHRKQHPALIAIAGQHCQFDARAMR